MKDAPLVSIVIPIYNVEKYLRQCMESVLTQTYKKFEIILVDDNTSDKSGKIADQYVKKDVRIKVIHKPKNEGLNMARSTGFEASKGNFITFIDSDDVVEPDFLEKIVFAQQRTQADIIMSGYTFVDQALQPLSSQPIKTYPLITTPTIYNNSTMLKKFLTGFTYWTHNNNPTTIPCKLIRRELLVGYDWSFSNYNIGEDDFCSLALFSQAKKTAVINDRTYLCRVNQESLSNSNSYQFKHDNKEISAFCICDDFMIKAQKLIGKEYINEIYYHTYGLYIYYIHNIIQKNSITIKDVKYFDEHFIHEEFSNIRKHQIDQAFISLASKGLLYYLTHNLNSCRQDQRRTAELEKNITSCNTELASHLSIKRSAQLLAGNIKRRVKKMIK